MRTLLQNQRFSQRQLLFVGLCLAVLGSIAVLRTFAAESSAISGTMWQDTNRNGVVDASEVPFANRTINLFDWTNNTIVQTKTDASGNYHFDYLSDGQYRITVDTPDWWDLRLGWTPTTGNDLRNNFYKDVTLAGSATVNIGLRQIVRSTDKGNPVSTYLAPTGLRVNSYDDIVTAQEIYNYLAKGTMFGGAESPYVTVDFDFYASNFTSSAAIQDNYGPYQNYHSTAYVTFESWLDTTDRTLFHEYGHAWSQYYGLIIQQDPELIEYQKVRGIYGDSRVNTTYPWQVREIIAEDYRQLFGTVNTATGGQINEYIPLAKDVPGLKEYLMGDFMHKDPYIPTVPRDLRGDGISPSQVKLDWAVSVDNVGITAYDIYRADPSRTDPQLVKTVSGSTTSYIDTGLSSSTTYNYLVRARDAAGNTSEPSSTISVNTLAPPPFAPTGLRTVSVTDTTASIAWTPASDASSVTDYDIYRFDLTSPTSQKVGTVNGPSTTYFDTGLVSSTAYTYTVKARNATGTSSEASNPVTLTTLVPDTLKPTAPTSLKQTNVTGTSASFSWVASKDNVGVVEYRIYKVGSSIPVKTIVGTSGTVTGLAKNTQYSFYVTAVDLAGNDSAPSATLKIRTARK